MSWIAFVRAALIPGEVADTKPTELRAYTDGSLWVRISGAILGLPAALGQLAASASTSVVAAAAGAPVFGQHTVATGTATALSGAATYTLGMTLYPDPGIDVYLAGGAITVGTAATTAILRAGGAPMVIAGPIDPSTIFALGASAGATVTWVGQ